MKIRFAFVALLLMACLRTQAQGWVNPLPVDGTSGHVTYRGQVKALNQSQDELGARFALYAATELANSTAVKVERGKKQPSTIKGNGQRVFARRGGTPPGTARRTLHYVLSIRPHDGYYEYELGELTNETPAVPAQGAPGAATAIAAKIGAVEGVLRNPTNYDKWHNPTAAFRFYCEAVDATALAVLADVQAALSVY